MKCQGGVEKIGMAVDKNYHNPNNKLSKKKEDNSNCVTIVKKNLFLISSFIYKVDSYFNKTFKIFLRI